jgi:hypothetical protein
LSCFPCACRITREIEQVLSTDEGQFALILCADGGVMYYRGGGGGKGRGSATLLATAGAGEGGEASKDAFVEAAKGPEAGGGGQLGASGLVELPALFRQKEQQQQLGSWALRRIGRQGHVVRTCLLCLVCCFVSLFP